MLHAPVPDVNEGPIESLLRDVRLRYGSERDSAREAADLAIRDRSAAMLGVLAAAAMPSAHWDDVGAAAQQEPIRVPPGVDAARAPWWAALGRVTSALATDVADTRLAAGFFDVARTIDPDLLWSRADVMACAQAYWDTGRGSEIEQIPVAPRALEWREGGLLALNALAHREGAESPAWLELANRTLLEPYGLAPISVRTGKGDPFDRLVAGVGAGTERGPLISVIMSTFQRGATLLTAVRSVIAQTWADWELLVIDDCSGYEYRELLDEVEALDPRIRVVHQEVNKGTYAARNRGISLSQGSFITFQDDDDWSHPERLARQVSPLLGNPMTHVTMSYALHLTDQLHAQFGGRRTRVLGSSTLMARAADLRDIGGFDEVRKGADTELIRRLDVVAPNSRVVLREPLAFMRLTENSLSRSEIRPGWVHPARSEYAEAASWWHRGLGRGTWEQARVGSPRPFPAPERMLHPAEKTTRHYDVVIIGDFSREFYYLSPAAQLLRSALTSGGRVGIVHLDTPYRGAAGKRSFIDDDVRRRLDGVTLRRVLPGESTTTRLAVIASAELMQFAERTRWDIECSEVLLVSDDAPVEAVSGGRWSAVDCVAATESLVGAVPTRLMVPQADMAPQIRACGLFDSVEVLPITGDTVTPSIAPRPRHHLPVVGRIGSHLPLAWPGTAADTAATYPEDGALDVRVLGHLGPATQQLGRQPRRWCMFSHDEISIPVFMQQLDFYVVGRAGPLDATEHRLIRMAMSFGRVVIFAGPPPGALGDAVVTCTPVEVVRVVRELGADDEAFARQTARARLWLDKEHSAAQRPATPAP
ncbi:MAG: glycosyltransferase family 2 protein [Demequina sp.]